MKLDFKDCAYISWFKYDESPEIQLEKNDIVVVKTGSSSTNPGTTPHSLQN